MSRHRRAVGRALIGAVAAAMLYLGPAAAITTASAHVQASSTDAVRGGTALVSFQVPNESTTGADTTALTVDLTNVSSVQAEAKQGWTTKLDRDPGSGKVGSVTWTAAPNGGIPADAFGLFRISVKLTEKLRYNLGYQYYGYNEQFGLLSTYENFHANTGYSSLLWSF